MQKADFKSASFGIFLCLYCFKKVICFNVLRIDISEAEEGMQKNEN